MKLKSSVIPKSLAILRKTRVNPEKLFTLIYRIKPLFICDNLVEVLNVFLIAASKNTLVVLGFNY